jgi:8-oxo-dGTP diphosphatase
MTNDEEFMSEAVVEDKLHHPKIGVGVIILRDGKVLLGKRRSTLGAGAWGFPGGHLEWKESFSVCARREVKEETGLEISSLVLGPSTNDIFVAEDAHYITVFVVAQASVGEPKILEPEKCEEWQWFHWHELPSPLFLPMQHLQKLGFSPFSWRGLKME